jgi:hypothetical protein
MMSPPTSQGANGEPAEMPKYGMLLISRHSPHCDMLSVSHGYMQLRPQQDTRAGSAWRNQGREPQQRNSTFHNHTK